MTSDQNSKAIVGYIRRDPNDRQPGSSSHDCIRFDSAEHLTQALLARFGAHYANSDWMFRGEPEVYEECMSHIDRLTFNKTRDLNTALAHERNAVLQFQRNGFFHLPEAERHLIEYSTGVLPLMRHYGAPTRLLDWSESPWIALYFACSTNGPRDGRMRCIDRTELRVYDKRHEGQIKASAEPAQSRLPALFTMELDSLDDWVAVYEHNGYRFPRLVAQQGIFTLASKPHIDHWKLTKGSLTKSLDILVPASQKATCLRQLERMGITAASLFPDAQGVARAINDHLYALLTEPHPPYGE